MAVKSQPKQQMKLRPPNDWRTTDCDETQRRRLRAQEESFAISNLDPQHPVFSNFRVKSGSGLIYSVEIRSIQERQFSCDCVDFRINGLGTCKHVEAVLLQLQGRFRRLFKAAAHTGATPIDVVPDASNDSLRIRNSSGSVPGVLLEWFDEDGLLRNGSPETALAALQNLKEGGCPQIRVSQDVQPWLENRGQAAERKQLRRRYELKVQSAEWPVHETKVPLFPYQREGMLPLAFTERALLADEMGLGKTIQAIAACALLHRLGQARRALVVTPASLKTEWEEQIQRFTDMPHQLLFGARHQRLKAYERAGKAAEALNPPARTKPLRRGEGPALSHRMGEGESSADPWQIGSTPGPSDYGDGGPLATRR